MVKLMDIKMAYKIVYQIFMEFSFFFSSSEQYRHFHFYEFDIK